jgi:hypothetical protein
MFSGLQIEALAHGCAKCAKPFVLNSRIRSAYLVRDIHSFEQQIELGIAGRGVRNLWLHVECADPTLLAKQWDMKPTIHHCIRCSRDLKREDLVVPVFSVDDPCVINPSDPSDKGLTLRERVFFMHADCTDALFKQSPILVNG